jgi:NADH-quinone oxidoreductase subunit H
VNGLASTYDQLAAWLAGAGLHAWLAFGLSGLVVYILPLALIVLPLAGLGQIFERKIAAAMQRRLGPNTSGLDGPLRLAVDLLCFWLPRPRRAAIAAGILRIPPMPLVNRLVTRSGFGQLLADGAKMLTKDDLVPAGADGLLFRLAPYLALCGAFLPFVFIPWSQHFVMLDISVAAFFLAGVSGLVAVGILMAGWGSNNKWSLLGGLRAVAQIVSYEIPVALCVAAVAMWAGTLSLQGLVAAQYNDSWFSLGGWNLLQSPFMVLLAGVFYVGALAECNRTPFDTAEAESELVSGFNTEYSGLRWGLFAMAEYTDMLMVGALFAVLFLGGYQSPFFEPQIAALPPLAETLIHAAILLAKIMASVFFMMWLRWTLPRLRIDQVMQLSWQKLLPLALVALAGLAVTMVLCGAAPGRAYGPITPPLRVDLGWQGLALGWILAGGALAALAWTAWRFGGGAPHPGLARLTAPAGKG